MGGTFSSEAEGQGQGNEQAATSVAKQPSALVVCGPSGVGKGTLIKKLMDGSPLFGFSCSHTTRQPREGEEVCCLPHRRSCLRSLICHSSPWHWVVMAPCVVCLQPSSLQPCSMIRALLHNVGLCLQNGIHYWFTTKEEFEKGIEQGRFLEHAHVHSNIYGTSYQVRSSPNAREASCHSPYAPALQQCGFPAPFHDFMMPSAKPRATATVKVACASMHA